MIKQWFKQTWHQFGRDCFSVMLGTSWNDGMDLWWFMSRNDQCVGGLRYHHWSPKSTKNMRSSPPGGFQHWQTDLWATLIINHHDEHDEPLSNRILHYIQRSIQLVWTILVRHVTVAHHQKAKFGPWFLAKKRSLSWWWATKPPRPWLILTKARQVLLGSTPFLIMIHQSLSTLIIVIARSIDHYWSLLAICNPLWTTIHYYYLSISHCFLD